MDHALGIDLILTEIFKNLSTVDLLTCSLVNKQWNVQARTSLQRGRGKCIAFIQNDSSGPCHELQQFDSDLRSMKIIPFNGLSIKIDGKSHKSYMCCPHYDPENPFPGILNNKKLKLKYIRIEWTRGNENCPAAKLIQKIVTEWSQNLEEIHVIKIPKNMGLHCSYDQLYLPKLKVLRLADDLPLDYLAREFLSSVISSATNLESLYSTPITPIQALQHLPTEKRLRILKDLVFNPVTVLDEVLYGRLALMGPKLCSLMITTPNHENDLCLEKCWEYLGQLLKSSQESLKLLSLDTRAAVMLIKFQIPLASVTTLMIDIDFSPNALVVRNALKKLNFLKLFPQVTSVAVSDDLILVNEVNYYVDEAEDTVDGMEIEPGSMERVTDLDVTLLDFGPESLNFLAELFPHVRTLSMCISPSISHELVRSKWPSLVSVTEENECV